MRGGGVPNLLHREFGVFLIRQPGVGITLGVVGHGPEVDRSIPGSGARMTLNLSGVTNLNYLGDAHSHPWGSGLPSVDDWNNFMFNNNQARLGGRTGETYFMYITAVDQTTGQPTATYVYEDGPRAANTPDPARPTTVGEEVNPNAQKC